jgi:3-deoxy-D-manno-octulosonic-acid transferase
MARSAMYLFYSLLLGLSLLITLPYWLIQMTRHGKYRAGLRQRLGWVRSDLIAVAGKPVIWVHAVSVGELVAVGGVIEELKRRFPSHRVLLSTTTATGNRLANRRFGEKDVFYFPLDFGFAIRPYLRALRPELVVIAETEFWPNFLHLAKQSGAQIAVINSRISDHSLRGYKRLRSWVVRVLKNVDLFLPQTDQDRQRLLEIGADERRLVVTGNLKFDAEAPKPPALVESLRAALDSSGAGPVLVCGSTFEGEEGALLSALRHILVNHPRTVGILAPRHPERFAEVAGLVEELGFRLLRRSLWSGEPLAGGVFLLDSIGELAAVYSLATVAFVGGSLVPRGGHNILEPALYGVPVLIGNHYDNFREIVNFFLYRNAVRVVGLAELPLTFIELIEHPERREALGRNALAALESQRGATARTVTALVDLMGHRA